MMDESTDTDKVIEAENESINESVDLSDQQQEPIKIDDSAIKELTDDVNKLIETLDDAAAKDAEFYQSIEAGLSELRNETELIDYLKEQDEKREKAAEVEKKTEEELAELTEAELQEYEEAQALLLEDEELFKERLLQEIYDTREVLYYIDHKSNLMTGQLETLIEIAETPTTTDNVIGFYGMVVIPAVIIIFSLWRMIRPFLP